MDEESLSLSLGPEQIIQINFINWFKHAYPELKKYIFHFANERKCSLAEGKVLKRMGVSAGVSDIFLAYPKNDKHGLWIEIKYGKNKLTDSQKKFLINMDKVGYEIAVARSLEECKQTILFYFQKS
jgi:hypothetical protein